ncbi:uncharacterized protein Dmoj_GI26014 [Drosophila mojavensis]|uniref:Uncharacterized protein n=1 Tax=Drosophila mojavensis TaxID=7230 RepID=A0A0Q9XH89_DROMO|nr:uncharacterized protein Dmoj_GI26014 [Drosophila mojavensis]
MSKSINILGFCLVSVLMLQYVCAVIEMAEELVPCTKYGGECVRSCGEAARLEKANECDANGEICCYFI